MVALIVTPAWRRARNIPRRLFTPRNTCRPYLPVLSGGAGGGQGVYDGARAHPPGRGPRGRGRGGLRSHTDPTSVCNAERLCGITHRDGHSETGQWRRITGRSSNCPNWPGANVGMPAVDDVTHPDRRLSPIRTFSSRGDRVWTAIVETVPFGGVERLDNDRHLTYRIAN